MRNKSSASGAVCALVANIIFGFSFLFSKVALAVAHPLIILAVRFTVAFLVLNVLWAFKIIKINIKGKPKARLLLMAVMQPLLYFVFELYGINKTSSALSGVIISLVPVAVLLLSAVFLKEKPDIIQIIFTVVSIGGVAAISLISGNFTGDTAIGIVYLAFAVVCAAGFNILSRKTSEIYTAVERTYIMFLVGAIGFNVIALTVLGGSWFNELTAAVIIPEFWGAVCYLAIASSVLAFLCYNTATSKISAIKAASFSNLITVVSVFAGVVILKEELNMLQIIICGIIIIGVFAVNASKEILNKIKK